jgi:hypothetical protein
MPVAPLHTPTSWHWSAALHVTGLEPTQLPAEHVSTWVQAFPSLQAVPVALGGLEQAPVAPSHTPTSWHWSAAVQVTGDAPVHAPAWHVSDCVHALPSLQDTPFVWSGLLQSPVAGAHVPAT